MTENKVEERETSRSVRIREMMERVKPNEYPGNPLLIDPRKLAEVLVEIFERWDKAAERLTELERLVSVGRPVRDTLEYKAGKLAALEEVRSSLPDDLPRGSMIGYDRLIEVLNELKKKYE